MNLWIRSQDKKHFEIATKIEISNDNEKVLLVNNKEYGTFKTKERTLEILDNIQTLVEEYYDCQDNDIVLAPVYSMPKE